MALYADAARAAHSLGLGVNAGHDLDLDNLSIFKALPHLDEVSIGHMIISRALLTGLTAASCANTSRFLYDGIVKWGSVRIGKCGESDDSGIGSCGD